MDQNTWEIFDVDQLVAEMGDSPVNYKEFLNAPSMHCGIYRLAKGSKDMQSPHDDDEMYYVVEGSAQLQVGDDVKRVRPGNLLYIRASEEHSFFEIEEDMVLLVLFARRPRG